MTKHPDEIVETAIALLTETVRAMCAKPELVRVRVREQEATITIEITAHPSDAKRLVGQAGGNFRALLSLTRLLFWGSRKLVNLYPIASLDLPEMPRAKFRPNPDWPKDKLASLLARMAGAVFRDESPVVTVTPKSEWASVFHVEHSDGPGDQVAQRFASVAGVLFTAIGGVRGHIIYAEVGWVADRANASLT